MSDPGQEHYSATQRRSDKAQDKTKIKNEVKGYVEKTRLKSVKHVARSVYHDGRLLA